MNKLKELYIIFHTKRRHQIEKAVEAAFQKRIEDGWSASPSTKKECLFQVMGSQNEEDQFIEYGKMLIQACIHEAYLNGDNVDYLINLIEDKINERN